MFCQKCGKEVDEEAVICPHCGCEVCKGILIEKQLLEEGNKSKTGIGILFFIFLGVIGLIIGICMYPSGTNSRQTFVRAWLISFAVCLGIFGLIILPIIIISTTIV